MEQTKTISIDSRNYITLDDASKLSQGLLSTRSLYNRIWRKTLPVTSAKINGIWYVLQSDYEEFLANYSLLTKRLRIPRFTDYKELFTEDDGSFLLVHDYDVPIAIAEKSYKVINLETGRIIQFGRDRFYYSTHLPKNGKYVKVYRHQLKVLFCPNEKSKFITHHIKPATKDCTDDRQENLLPVTDIEHAELGELYSNGNMKEYKKKVRAIQKDNKKPLDIGKVSTGVKYRVLSEEFQDIEQAKENLRISIKNKIEDEYFAWIYLDSEGYELYKQGNNDFVNHILAESFEPYKKTVMPCWTKV